MSSADADSAATAQAAPSPDDVTYEAFEQMLGPQLRASGVPAELWQAVHQKLRHQEFDAGAYFGFALQDDDEPEGARVLAALNDIQAPSTGSYNVWLVDHAWSFAAGAAVANLRADDALRTRVAAMLFGPGDAPTASIEDILGLLWKRARHYSVNTGGASAAAASSGAGVEVWYMADEVGTAIMPVVGADDANVCIAPIYYPPLQAAFDIVWPTKAIEAGEQLYYDVARGFSPEAVASHPRWAKVWTGGDDEEEMDRMSQAKFRLFRETLEERGALAAKTLERVAAGELAHQAALDRPALPAAGIRVFVDRESVAQSLAASASSSAEGGRYTIVEKPEEADIVWLSQPAPHGLAPLFPKAKYVAQFAHEEHVCNNAQRDTAVRTVLGAPAWLPRSFDANAEADLFVGAVEWADSQATALKERGLLPSGDEDPTAGLKRAWAVRPHAAGVAAASTDLDLPLRSGEAVPALLQEFVRRPLTLQGVKFSLQFALLVRSWSPLEAFVLKRFQPRFAAAPMAGDSDDVHILPAEIHVTTEAGLPGKESMSSAAFTEAFAEEAGSPDVFDGLCRAARAAIFDMAAAVSVHCGDKLHAGLSVNGPRAGALYAVDVVFERDVAAPAAAHKAQPKILSVDFMPGCARHVAEDPRFFEGVFDILFGGGADVSGDVAWRLVHSHDIAAPNAGAAAAAEMD